MSKCCRTGRGRVSHSFGENSAPLYPLRSWYVGIIELQSMCRKKIRPGALAGDACWLSHFPRELFICGKLGFRKILIGNPLLQYSLSIYIRRLIPDQGDPVKHERPGCFLFSSNPLCMNNKKIRSRLLNFRCFVFPRRCAIQ